ncbi:MAG: leucine-rich repeat protein, partial [Leucobacter sp.]|nr:leucine-rich repeat protein [Leucobacter sp.]
MLTLVLGMLVVPANSAQAAPASATVDGLVLEADSSTPDAGATITGFTGDLGESVTIPELVEIDGIDYVVTTIGEQALEGAPVSSVVIPDSVTTIRSRAFFRAQLTSLVLPESVTSLGTLVFGENPLASLHWPDNGLDVPDFTFSTNKLTEVVIPPSVRRIGASAFQNGQIKSVDLGNVEVIGQSAFSTNQITDLTIPESTSHILGMAFYANQIENLEFLTTGPLRIRGHVFARNQITKLVLPGTLELDRYSAFEDNKISDLTISEGMTSLHLTMFKNNRLTSVTIPASMSKLEAHVFVDNPDLTEIYFDGDAPAELFPASVAGEQDNESLPSKTATIFFHCFAKGFTTPLWQGYNTLPNPDTACSVDFDTLGGEPVPPKQELEYGGFATPPADTPVRAGSVFTGWYTSPEATDLFDFAGTEVTAPLTLYAGWRDSIPRTVSFDSHGGSAVAGVTVEHGEAVAKPTPDPARAGYT